MSGLIGVTGTTGIVGGQVAALLAERGPAQRLIVRRLTGHEPTALSDYMSAHPECLARVVARG
jgi:uncharacterized protein YbjT (DUF2867 family)